MFIQEDSNGYTHKDGIVYKNQFHIVFCPKYRRAVLTGAIEVRLKEIVNDVCNEKGVHLKAIEVMPDHVHLFIDFDPRIMLHKVIKDIKGRSARLLRDEFPSLKSRMPNMWTRSYFCCSIGHISEETIQAYIENQKNV